MLPEKLAYLIALHSVDGLGTIRLKRILDYFKDPKDAWNASIGEFSTLSIPQPVLDKLVVQKKNIDPENYFEQIRKEEIKVLTFFDPNYPTALKQIYDPPLILYYKGEILANDAFSIAVVGTRRITSYGKIVTEKLSTELSQAGLTIISGLASGVDTIAHWAAINNKGRTLAVLGGGLKQIFPSENVLLAKKIIDGFGALISEFPPDYPSLPGNFPARNRIVAGLSLGILVTEAAEDSGSLITARLGLEMGKEVYAVPGPITSSLTFGTANLIKEGAKVVMSAKDILEDLNIFIKRKDIDLTKLTGLQIDILNLIENDPKHLDEIARSLKSPITSISAELIKMEIQGVIKNMGGGVYSRLF